MVLESAISDDNASFTLWKNSHNVKEKPYYALIVDTVYGSKKQTMKIFLKIKQQISNKTSPILEKS